MVATRRKLCLPRHSYNPSIITIHRANNPFESILQEEIHPSVRERGENHGIWWDSKGGGGGGGRATPG